MLIVISPAKRLDWSERETEMTTPAFQEDAMRLVKTARNLTLKDLQGLMDISHDLAKLNRDRFKAFAADPAPETLRPAAFAFDGDTYQGLEAETLDADALDWAQRHLRILSGLYGLLRPMDAIQPYRLEMGSRLKTRRGGSLYDYWGDQLTRALKAQAQEIGAEVLVNCASQEYFGAVQPEKLGLRVITPVFMEMKKGEAKIVSFYAKKARGAMARYAAERHLSDAEALKEFDTGGYAYQPQMSDGERWVFLRDGEA